MRPFMSWFCVDAQLPVDEDVMGLSSNNSRWVYFCLLCLEKEGKLEGKSFAQIIKYAHMMHISAPVVLGQILTELLESGLLDSTYRPKGFKLWQEKALKANRNKRAYQVRKSAVSPESVGSKSDVSTSYTDTDTDTDTDKSKNKKKNKCRAKDPTAAKLFDHEVETVMAQLRLVTERNFEREDDVRKCMKREKCNSGPLLEVIGYLYGEWEGTEMIKHLNTSTPFIPSKFGKYLDEARAGGITLEESFDQRKARAEEQDKLDREAGRL